jgi:hypothetical protein
LRGKSKHKKKEKNINNEVRKSKCVKSEKLKLETLYSSFFFIINFRSWMVEELITIITVQHSISHNKLRIKSRKIKGYLRLISHP